MTECAYLITSRGRRKGSPSQSQGRPHISKDYRVKFPPGSHVRERDIVVTQGKLDYHPGLYTGIDPRNRSIYALRAGTLVITTEKISPDLTHDLASKYYGHRVGQNIHKRVVNVIPDRQKQVFRLVDLV